MSTDRRQPNTATVRKLFEAFNHDDPRPYDELVAPEYAGPQGNQRGPAALRLVAAGLRAAFPDLHYALDEVLAEGDDVAVRWHWTGTHQAPFRGYAPTGRPVTNTGLGIFRVRDGKIVSSTIETDRLGFLQQIGVVPEGVGTGAKPPQATPGTGAAGN